MLEWLFLLLPVAATISWWQGRNSAIKQFEARYNHSLTKGINYYLNNDSDASFEQLKKIAKQQSDNFEAHVTLGNMFRKRGEIDRAISIHQTILANLNMDSKQRDYILYELANDYQAAGLLDRAEQLLHGLVYSSRHQDKYLVALLTVYESMGEWEKAATVMRDTGKRHGGLQAYRLAHYLCEMATLAATQNRNEQAIQWVQEALLVQGNSVRCYWELANLYYKAQYYEKAIHALESLHRQSSAYYNLTLPMLQACFAALDKQQTFVSLLHSLHQKSKDVMVTLALVDEYVQQGDAEQAKQLLLSLLEQKPSLRALKSLIQIETQQLNKQDDIVVKCVEHTLQAVIDKKAYYQCRCCGFETHKLRWRCPSCATWDSLIPLKARIHDAE